MIGTPGQSDGNDRRPDLPPETPRHCLACGYNLFGLGEEPRCPECGLRHVPSVYREQVWELVDSGKWFFSGFFTPWRKRLPGWWWALDRPGDLRRSFRFAVVRVLISTVLILVFVAAADAVRIEITWRYAYGS